MYSSNPNKLRRVSWEELRKVKTTQRTIHTGENTNSNIIDLPIVAPETRPNTIQKHKMVPSVQRTHQQQYRRIRIVTALLLLLPMSVETSSSASSASTTTTQSSKKHNNAVDSSEPYYASLQGRLKLMRRCESTTVYVNRIYLTCDSPGEWNEEASSGEGYRQSSRCKYGDQANAYIFFSLSQDYSGNGIEFTIDSGVLDSFVNVQSRTSLCAMGSITYISGATNSITNDEYADDDVTTIDDNSLACLTPGIYQLQWSFVVPKGGGDAQLQYTPDLRIKFYSTGTNTTLGCAGAGTMATVQQAELHIKEGEIALGVALTALFGIFGVCLCMAYRRKKQVEMANQQEEDVWQPRRMSLTRRNSSTADMDPNESLDEGGTSSYVLEESETESRQMYRGDAHHRYHHHQQQQQQQEHDDDMQDSLTGPQHLYYRDHDLSAITPSEYGGTNDASYSLSSVANRLPAQHPRSKGYYTSHHHPAPATPPAREYVHPDYDEAPSAQTDSSIPYVVDISSLDGQSRADSAYWNPPSPPPTPSYIPKSLRNKF